MSVQELHLQSKQLTLLQRQELVRLLNEDLVQPQSTLSWYGIGNSDITDLSLRDEELLFERNLNAD